MKKLMRIVGILAIVLVVGVVVLYLCAGLIIAPIVASTASKSMGVTTLVGGADLHAFAGNLVLSDLDVGNPKPFESPRFVAFKSCSVTLEPSSLMSNKVKIDEITIDGLELTMEQRGIDSNVGTIMKNLNAAAGTSEGGKKELEIDKVILTNTKIIVRAGGLPGMKAQGFDITLDKMQIDRPTDKDGRLPKMADLLGQILAKVADQAAKDPHMPKEMRDVMGSVGQLGDKFTKGLGTGLQEVGKDTKGALDGIGNLFGKKKDSK
jgi:hypothetical protein